MPQAAHKADPVTPATMPVQGKDSLKLAPFHPKYRDPKTTTLSYEVVAEPKAGAYDLALTPAP